MEHIDGASLQQVIPRLAAAPTNVVLRLPAIGSEPTGQNVFVRVQLAAQSPGIAASGSPDLSDLPALDLLNLALDGLPYQPAPTAARQETGDSPTTDLPGAIGPGPDLSVVAGILLTRPHYHRLCCEWVRDAARGVQHAHERGIIHRDLKPGNMMLGRDGRVRVIDFGLARCFEDATLTSTGQLLGSPLYMSPEQVTGRIELSPKTDIYSLGLVLYELLTLGPPLTARSREELFQRIIAKPLEPLTYVNPSVTRAIEAIVHKATAKDPDDRYEKAGSFADDLERVLAGRPVAAPMYQLRESEAEVLNTRPPLIAAIAAQFYLGAFFWMAYGTFLMAMKDAPGRDRVPLPLLSLGWLGGVSAFALVGVLVLAAVWMAKGYRHGYGVGLVGQLVLMASTFLCAYTFNWLRSFEGDRLLWIILACVANFLWQALQLKQYGRRAVRSWFDLVQRLRQVRSPGKWFRGRSLYVRR